MSLLKKAEKPAATVVEKVLDQTRQAADLASIEGQARLADPRTNPATRDHADELRNQQLTVALDAEHARLLRRHRVLDGRAAEAERTLEAIALARRASSPARSVLALHNGKRRYVRVCLAAALTLAVGSAMGVEACAVALGGPWGSGYIAEVGLTGLAIAAITYRAHLAEHCGELEPGSWQSRTLWAWMTIPLLVSVACNLATLNIVGAVCAVFAVAFSTLSCVVADRSSEAMQARAGEVTDDDELEIRQVALGEDLFVPVVIETTPDTAGPALEEGTGADSAAEDQAAEGEGQDDEHLLPEWIEAALAEGDAAMDAILLEILGVDSGPWSGDWAGDEDPDAPLPPAAGGGGGLRLVPRPAPEPVPVPILPVGIDSDQSGRRPQVPAVVLPAVQARIAIGAATRQAIADYQAAHPKATIAEIAEGLSLSVTTVKDHRRVLRAGGDR
jgi:hypothetical protein